MTREAALANVSIIETALEEYRSKTRLLEDLAKAEKKTFDELVDEVLDRDKYEFLHSPELLKKGVLAKLNSYLLQERLKLGSPLRNSVEFTRFSSISGWLYILNRHIDRTIDVHQRLIEQR